MDTRNFNLSALSRDELVELVKYHNRRYWELGEPEISDARYDEIVEALRRLDPTNPLLEEINTPTVYTEGKVTHREPMLSLDKAYSPAEVIAWARKYARTPDEVLLVEPKYDGISADFDGRVLSTRGDGEVGENISDKIPLIELETTGYTGPLDRPVRGELVIRDDDFASIYSHVRKKDGGFYKNSRNAVAGLMGLKDISPMLAQGAKLTLVDYNLISESIPLSELSERWEELSCAQEQLPYPRDGIVFKLADRAYAASLGSTAHHPRGEIAFKFTNIRRETRVADVEWSFGKNSLTPVALLDPVEISGTTIRRATLHNAQNIAELDLMIGDRVIVERAGDVIPYIVCATPGEERRPALISECPACGAGLVRRGPELCCPNPDCPETRLQRLLAATRSLGIERLGEPTLRKLMKSSGVTTPRQLFELTAADLLRLDGFGPKSAANLLGEIARARTVRDYQLLAALNIPHVGLNIARMLLTDRTLAELRNLSAEELAALPGIGPERAAALVAEFSSRRSELDELLEAVTLIHGDGGTELPAICFTGKMPEKRSFYEKLAAERGYRPVDSVSSTLALLVAADVNASGSKLQAARRLGLKIVSLEEFLASAAPAPVDGNRREPEAVQGELF